MVSTDENVRRELGARLQAQRLLHNWDQESLAYEAGISQSTLYRLEKGGSVSLDALIRVLRVLGLLERLDALVPQAEMSPVAQVRESRQKLRKRATGTRKTSQKNSGWQGFGQSVSFDDSEGD
ncbi:helix-turn-helix domain-containing protein [Teredinibacter turnerae]|uniref:helix-turn-helix domain-containing protein n=1 Tax=Teredinibacter turnerae TaxID=2426 RepID=UPI0003610BC2|nr:helix-turn-helix transcriptional regulator [Teredinibacter turnerae]